jgi:hypothetical protein
MNVISEFLLAQRIGNDNFTSSKNHLPEKKKMAVGNVNPR